MPEPGEKPNPVEVAMGKDCIFLVVAMILRDAIPGGATGGDVKCTGPECGQFVDFIGKCGFSA